jgi:putative phage-type endonuclease
MSALIIGDSQDRPAWLAKRKHGIGGSDAPAIMGLSPFGSPITVYLDKVDPTVSDEPMPPYVELGLELEPYLMRKVAELYEAPGYELDGQLYQSTERPWQMCTLDGKLIDNGSTTHTELKTRAFLDDEWKNDIPMDISVQVQHQIDVMELDKILLGVLFRVSGEVLWKEIYRDEKFILDVLRPTEEQFWEKVVAQDPSDLEVDGKQATAKALAKLAPEDAGAEAKIMGAEFLEVTDELVALRERRKQIEEEIDLFRNRIAKEIGSSARGLLPDGRYFNYKTTNVKERKQAAYSFRVPMGPFGKAL